jgi:hypothetical protein
MRELKLYATQFVAIPRSHTLDNTNLALSNVESGNIETDCQRGINIKG